MPVGHATAPSRRARGRDERGRRRIKKARSSPRFLELPRRWPVMSGPPDGLDPVNARERMSRFEQLYGWAMIDVRSHRRSMIGAWFHGSLRAGSEDHQERDYLLSYRTGASSDKSSECFFQG